MGGSGACAWPGGRTEGSHVHSDQFARHHRVCLFAGDGPVGGQTILAKLSAFDAILGFILASMLARAVNGSSAFFETMGAGFVLVLFHRLLAKLACHCDWFSKLIKGRADVLVENGRKIAPIERSGEISVVPAKES